ncbi:hypothetical protein ACPPVU_03335 [Mucilaginibacter sp. McL0603]
MSKDKGSKNIKKLPTLAGNKTQSDYQAGKNSSGKVEIVTTSKKSK